MFPSTTTWSNLVKSKSLVNDTTSWPKFSKNQPKVTNLKASVNLELETEKIVQKIKNVNLNHKTQINNNWNREDNNDNRTREEILEDRRIRRKKAKEEKKLKNLEEKAQKIRSSKSQKIQIIDKSFLDKYIKLSTDKTENINSSINNHQFDRKSIKHKLKNKHAIALNLNELIVKKTSEKLQTEINQNKRLVKTNLKIIKKHKGKQHEFPRKKWSPLKKNILRIRTLRREIREESYHSNQVVSDVNLNKENVKIDNAKENDEIKNKIKHSRKFRPYCNNFITLELCAPVESLLRDIFRFQKRAYDNNEIKGRAKRRYFVGFNEVQRHLNTGKIKLLLIAPDLEPNEGPDGIDSAVDTLKMSADKLEVPYVFSINRRKMGYLLLKKVPISCIGICNYEGCEENFKKIMEILQEERSKYSNANALQR